MPNGTNGRLRTRDLSDIERSLCDLQVALAKAQAEIALLQAQVQSIKSSTCWRATLPIRYMVDLIRRLLRGEAARQTFYPSSGLHL